jgi:hypothetical protein
LGQFLQHHYQRGHALNDLKSLKVMFLKLSVQPQLELTRTVMSLGTNFLPAQTQGQLLWRGRMAGVWKSIHALVSTLQ